jgi:hypothetical protein
VRTSFARAIASYDSPSCSRTSRFARESVVPPWKADIPPIIIDIIATIMRTQNRATTESPPSRGMDGGRRARGDANDPAAGAAEQQQPDGQ